MSDTDPPIRNADRVADTCTEGPGVGADEERPGSEFAESPGRCR